MLNNILEISKRVNKNGRVPIKIALLKIHNNPNETNKNGLHWKKEYVEKAMDTAIGMPFCAEFVDEEKKEIPLGHGLTGEITNSDGIQEPIFENSEVVGTCEKVSIETIKDESGDDIEVLCGEGFLYAQRYPRFVKWVRKNYALGNVFTSIEIMGTVENDNKIIYEESNPTNNFRTPMEMAFSGSCILNISPADDDAVIIEVAQKKEKKEENSKMEFDMNEIKNAIKETISEMNEKSEAYETQISELNTQIENKNTELAKKTSMIEEKDTKISELNASIADMQKLLDDMKKDQETTWAEMDILQKEIAKAKVAEKLGELDSALAEFSAEEKEVAKDDIEKLKSEISACEKKEELNSIDEKITAIKSEICMSIVAEQKKAAADAKIAEQNSARNDDVEDIFSEMCEDIDAEEKEEDTNIF